MRAMRLSTRRERWELLSQDDKRLAVLGVMGKALVPVAVLVLVISLAAASPVSVVGGVMTAVTLGMWWAAARGIGRLKGISTTRVMWNIWRVGTWTVLGDALSVFDVFDVG